MIFHATTAGVRGINTQTPLVYLLRDDLIPKDEATGDAKDYSDLDHELIARHLIVHKDHIALDVLDLKKAGTRKKVANVNTDNAALFLHLKTCFEGTSWWTHAKSATKNKDGRCAWFALELNLQPMGALHQADINNKTDIQMLHCRGETRQWGLLTTSTLTRSTTKPRRGFMMIMDSLIFTHTRRCSS